MFDAFRLLQELVTVPANEREAMFFGGLFAYDLVAGFEDLPPLQSDTACPDYCFYLAETLLVIDQTKHTRIQASLFTPLESEKQRLEQRLSQLRQQLNAGAAAGHYRGRKCAATLTRAMKSTARWCAKCSARSAPGNLPGGPFPPLLAALPVAAGRV